MGRKLARGTMQVLEHYFFLSDNVDKCRNNNVQMIKLMGRGIVLWEEHVIRTVRIRGSFD